MRKFVLSLAAALLLTASAHAADSVAGKWTGEVQGRNGPQTVTVELKVAGDKATGTMTTGDNPAVNIEDGMVKGADVTFAITRSIQGNDVKIPYTGEAKGDEFTMTRGQPAGAPPPANPPTPAVLKRVK